MSLLKTGKRKTKIRARAKTGIQGVGPSEMSSFERMAHYFHAELSYNDYADIIGKFIKNNYSKDEALAALALPKWKYGLFSRHAALCHWLKLGLPKTQQVTDTEVHFTQSIQECIKEGTEVLKTLKEEETKPNNVVVISPMERLGQKVNETILTDLDVMIDEWIEGEETSRDVYQLFQKYDLKAASVEQVKRWIDVEYEIYIDAYAKTCDQAVEALSHLDRNEIKRRITVFEVMLQDLQRIKNTATVQRASRKKVRKPQSAEKQIKNLKYKKNDNEYKIVSVNPIVMVGSTRVYCFNTKTRTLTLYTTSSTAGLGVKGTTIHSFDPNLSWSIRLRKPEETIPFVLGRSDKTIEKEIDKLTTKKSVPNGRINTDTVILRAI